MAIWGYWRCSTEVQDEERQVSALKAAGCERLFGDKITGTSSVGSREQLTRCLDGLREGDVLVLDELSRLSRKGMVEMLVVVNDLLERGISIKSLDGRLDTTAMAPELVKLIVGILGYASEIELKHLKRRTAEGRAVAKSRGVKFGRKRSYTPQQAATVMEMRDRGDGYGTIASALGMTKGMVRRITLNHEQEVAA
jgi:DNA invertase Pin-like site-specific DNA recombinase